MLLCQDLNLEPLAMEPILNIRVANFAQMQDSQLLDVWIWQFIIEISY